MRNLTAAGFAALFLLGGSPAAAQVMVSVPLEKARVAIENIQTSRAAVQRALDLASAARPDMSGIATPDGVLAAIEVARPRIDDARSELTLLASQIRALPAVAEPSDPAELRATEALRMDMAVFVGRIRDSLTVYPDLGDAIRAGDRDLALALSARAKETFAFPYDAQALNARSMVAFVGTDRSDYAQGMIFVCLNEGMAAYVRTALNLLPGERAAQNMSAAIDCAKEQLANGRTAMLREAGTQQGTRSQRETRVRWAAVARRGLDEAEVSIPLMEEARADVIAGNAMHQVDKNIRRFNAINEHFIALGNEQAAIILDQGQ